MTIVEELTRLRAEHAELLEALTDCANALTDVLPQHHPHFAVLDRANRLIAKATIPAANMESRS